MNIINRYIHLFALFAICSLWLSCQPSATKNQTASFDHLPDMQSGKLDTATFAAGCFWCVEAQFKTLEGVQQVISGYTGGKTNNPTYAQVSTGATGYAEAINVIFDPKKLSLTPYWKLFYSA